MSYDSLNADGVLRGKRSGSPLQTGHRDLGLQGLNQDPGYKDRSNAQPMTAADHQAAALAVRAKMIAARGGRDPFNPGEQR